ncbi:hypothetical protein RAS1_21550 [Phycisphaerae bacterium RAS1]|nr:hypothetical protein RAS1_21550 [Phycisphaerae bacterium RAS1]
MDERSRHRDFESRFLQQLRTRAQLLTRGVLPADRVEIEGSPDGVEAVRASLRRLDVLDRNLADDLPGALALQLRFSRRVLGGLMRFSVSRLRGRIIAPVDAMLNGKGAGPVGREEVLDALARYELLPSHVRPSAVVFGSATGFNAAAKALVSSTTGIKLILIGGRDDGGWEVTLPESVEKSPWKTLFEFETQDERLRRLNKHLDERGDLLDSRGVPLAELSEKLGLPEPITEALVRKACRADSRLMTINVGGSLHVCRSPLEDEVSTMSLWSRIRRLLRLKPSVAERVRTLTEQRVKLESGRSSVDRKVDALEGEERAALEQGAAAGSDAVKKQIAGKLVRVRRELKRARTQAQMYSQQIDVIGTHIHHLTLKEQGRRMELPKAEDLTREAAEAERVISELSVNADLARSIEVSAETPMMADEEAAIMAEFEQAATKKAESASGAGSAVSGSKAGAGPERGGAPPVPGAARREDGARASGNATRGEAARPELS